jgi:hypothetical protein
MKKRLLLPLFVVALFSPSGVAFAQEGSTELGLGVAPITSTLLYGLIGVGLYVLGYFVFDRIFRLDLRRELVEDQNIALGVMMAGVFVGIALIISAAIR